MHFKGLTERVAADRDRRPQPLDAGRLQWRERPLHNRHDWTWRAALIFTFDPCCSDSEPLGDRWVERSDGDRAECHTLFYLVGQPVNQGRAQNRHDRVCRLVKSQTDLCTTSARQAVLLSQHSKEQRNQVTAAWCNCLHMNRCNRATSLLADLL